MESSSFFASKILGRQKLERIIAKWKQHTSFRAGFARLAVAFPRRFPWRFVACEPETSRFLSGFQGHGREVACGEELAADLSLAVVESLWRLEGAAPAAAPGGRHVAAAALGVDPGALRRLAGGGGGSTAAEAAAAALLFAGALPQGEPRRLGPKAGGARPAGGEVFQARREIAGAYTARGW